MSNQPDMFEGYLERIKVGISSFILDGWILNKETDSSPDHIDIYLNDHLVSIVTAFYFREDLLQHKKGDGKCAFSIEIPRPSFNDDVNSIKIGVSTFSNVLTATENTEVTYTGGFCHFDCIMENEFKAIGWACDPKNPSSRIKVFLYDGETLLGEDIACLFRHDLIQANIGDGYYGVSIDLPYKLFDGKTHDLHLIAITTVGSIESNIIEFSATPFDVPWDHLDDFSVDKIPQSIINGLREWKKGDYFSASQLLGASTNIEYLSLNYSKILEFGYELLVYKKYDDLLALISKLDLSTITNEISCEETQAALAFLTIVAYCYHTNETLNLQSYMHFFSGKKGCTNFAVKEKIFAFGKLLYTSMLRQPSRTYNPDAYFMLSHAFTNYSDKWKICAITARIILRAKYHSHKFLEVIALYKLLNLSEKIRSDINYIVLYSYITVMHHTPEIISYDEDILTVLPDSILYNPHKVTPLKIEIQSILNKALYTVLLHSNDIGKKDNPYFAVSYRKKSIHFLTTIMDKMHILEPGFNVSYNRPFFKRILLIKNTHLPQCYYYRVKQKIEQIDEFLDWNYTEISDYDIAGLGWQSTLAYVDMVIIARIALSPDLSNFMAYAKSLDIPILYDIDDLIFDEKFFPGSFDEYADTINKELYWQLFLDNSLFHAAMQNSSGFIASTAPLGNAINNALNLNIGEKPTWIHKNSIGIELLRLSKKIIEAKKTYDSNNKVTIFYGSATKAHKKIFYDILLPALNCILDSHSHTKLKLIGFFNIPELLNKHGERITLLEPKSSYWDYLNEFVDVDVNLSILENSSFTDCKSEIKWLEAAVFKIPSIVTPTATYAQILQDKKTVLFAQTTQEWTDALSYLIGNKKRRESLGNHAYELALAQYAPKQAAQNLSVILESTVSHKQKKKSVPRVLFVNVFYAPQSIGGATRVVENQVKEIKSLLGDKIELYVLCADAHPKPRAPYEIEQYVWDNVLVTRLFVPTKAWSEYKDENVFEFATNFFRSYDFDLIHIHCLQYLTASVAEAAKKLHIPYVITVHDAWWVSRHLFLINSKNEPVNIHTLKGEIEDAPGQESSEAMLTDAYNKTLNAVKFRKQHLLHILKDAHKVMAVSEKFGRLYESTGLTNVIVNENGIEPFDRLARVKSLNNKVRVAHIGGNAYHKGFHLFKSALEKFPYENIEALVIDYHLEPGEEYEAQWGTVKVSFLPKFNQNTVNELYSKIDILVAPSVWPESYGLVTREAKYAGVWVIASDRGSIGADVLEGVDGNVISVENDEALADCFLTIDKQPSRYLSRLPVTDVRESLEQGRELAQFYMGLLEQKGYSCR
jgi:glycosyltransferase involved in cell wall biosynthesis